MEENNLNSINQDNKIKNKKILTQKEIIAIISFSIMFTIIFVSIYFVAEMVYNNVYNNTHEMRATLAKPIIYLYPEEETVVTVELGSLEKLTCVYPEYDSNWEVIAKPNGELTDLKTGRSQYALYWEGKNTVAKDIEEGFCVKGKDSAKFLEEKLSQLGLTEREANEFIIYWLPQLEKNKYNLIGFETIEEINEDMPLKVTPEPDTIIRVMMKFKGLEEYQEIKEQELASPERKGFVVVEWGGTEVKGE